MTQAKAINTPLAQKNGLHEATGGLVDASMYKRIVESLQYLTLTRPDITHAINLASQFMQSPNTEHFQGFKRILGYIKGTLHHGLRIISHSPCRLYGYSDADWGVLVLAFSASSPEAEARAFFVFGDSLVDNGNNNYLVTSARADSPFYGIDYPTHRATGRFSNGLNMPDIISEQLGMEPTLPYLAPELTGERLLVGANFASAGVGILNDKGIQFEGEV
ncbi:GDSL esterase/lipase [Capsicum chinense]|nr:GDSL esterase/lipase [Capsicum chinense]